MRQVLKSVLVVAGLFGHLYFPVASLEASAISKLAVLSSSGEERQLFTDSESVGFRIELNISPEELPATFSFMVRDPRGNTCLTIENYQVKIGQNYCGGEVLNIPISRFFSIHGTYTLIGSAVFATGPPLFQQKGFFISDTSPPTSPSGLTDEGDTTHNPNRLSCSWTSASDPQSGIREYLYCIGTSPGLDNTVSWRSCGISTSVVHTGLSLTEDTTYYFSIKAVNGAGLSSAIVSSNGIIYRSISSQLRINLTPTILSFARDETTRTTTLRLQAAGASNINLNRQTTRIVLSNGSIFNEHIQNISLNISAGATSELPLDVVITDALRTRVLAGRDTATFTVTYNFSGSDASSNPINASISLLVELRSEISDEESLFRVSDISLQMPSPHPLAYNLNDEVYPNLEITATGEGDITARIFVDGTYLGEITRHISEDTTLRLSTITTSASGEHTLRVELTSPGFLSESITYQVSEEEDLIARLSELLLLDGIAELIDIDATAVAEGPGYILNGVGTISIIPLAIALPINISGLEIRLNPTNLRLSSLHAGRIYAEDIADRLFDLFGGLLPIKALNFGIVRDRWKLTLAGAVKLPAVLGVTDEFPLDTAFEVSTEGLRGTVSAIGTPLCNLNPGIFNLRVSEFRLSAFREAGSQRFALYTDADFSIPSIPALGEVLLEDMLINPDGSFSGNITLPDVPTFNIGGLNITLPTDISFDSEGIIVTGRGRIQIAGQRLDLDFNNFKLGERSPLSIYSGSATIRTGFNIPIGDAVRLGLPARVVLSADGLTVSGAGNIAVNLFGETHTATVNFRDLGISFEPFEIQSGSAQITTSLRIPIADIANLQLPTGISFNRDGLIISGEGRFNIEDIATVTVRFDDFLIGFSPFEIESGTATLEAAIDIPIGDAVRLGLPARVVLSADGLTVSGAGNIAVNLFGETHTATVNFRDLGISFEPFEIQSGSAEITTSLRIPIADIANLQLPTGISFNRDGLTISGEGSFNIENIATVTAIFRDLIITYSPFEIGSGSATIRAAFDIPLGDIATFNLSPGVTFDREGIHVTGAANLRLRDDTRIGIDFDDVKFDFDDLWIQEGSISFDTGFAFKVVGTGSELSWGCYQQNASVTTAEISEDFGVVLNLPRTLSLNSSGFQMDGTSSIKLKFGDYDFEMAARFVDGFNVAVGPDVEVSTGSVRFFFEDLEVGHIDSDGLNVDWAGLILAILPAEIPLPTRDIAYLKVRDEEDNLLVNYETVAEGRRIYTIGTNTVNLYIPALKGEARGTPTVRCQFDVVVDSDFVPLFGSVTAGLDELSLEDWLGIPLTLAELRYRHPQGGNWSLNFDGMLNLPFTLSGDEGTTSIVFRDIGITSRGLVGTITCGSYTETFVEPPSYIGNFSLDVLTLKINGAQANLAEREFKVSGDIEIGRVLEKRDDDEPYPIHFALEVTTDGICGTVTFPSDFSAEIDLALIEFEITRLNHGTGPPLVVGFILTEDEQNVTIQLDGILRIPDLNEFELTIDNLIIDKTGIRDCDISYPEGRALTAQIFGLDFYFYDVTSGRTTYPAISISSINTDGETYLSLSLSGKIVILEGEEGEEDIEVEFHGLTITSEPSISGTFTVTPNIELIPDILTITQFAFHSGHSSPVNFYCNIKGTLNLPEPLELAHPAEFNLAIDSSGEGSFNVTVAPDIRPLAFYILQLDITQLTLNLRFEAGRLNTNATHIRVNGGLKYRSGEGRWSEGTTSIGFRVDFNGDIDLTGVTVPMSALSFLPDVTVDGTRYEGIDFEIGYLGINNLGFNATSTKLCFNIDGCLGFDISEAVAGGIKFEGFTLKVPKNGGFRDMEIDYECAEQVY